MTTAIDQGLFDLVASLAMVACLRSLYVSAGGPDPDESGDESGRLQLQKRQLTSSENPSTVESSEPDVAAFLKLSPQLRRQALRYGTRWREGVSR